MTGIAAPNLPTYADDSAAVTSRNAEITGTPFTDIDGDGSYDDPYLGMNRAGGNAPGIGIATGVVYQTAAEVAIGPRYDGWTEDDQFGVPRIPQTSQVIGGIGFVARSGNVATTWDPSQALYTEEGAAGSGGVEGVGDLDIRIADDAAVDYNNTANFVITDVAAADGAVMDTVSGAINNTGQAVGIGDLVWGQVPVA